MVAARLRTRPGDFCIRRSDLINRKASRMRGALIKWGVALRESSIKRGAVLLFGSCLALPTAAAAPEASPETSVQVWIGAIKTDNDSWKATDVQSGSDVVGDLGTLPFGGGDGQVLWGSGIFQIGYEGGGIASWKNETTHFRGVSSGGTAVQVQFKNQFFLFGVF